jgi:predicted DNA-binding protein
MRPHTIEDMRKDATITVRVPRPTRRRLEALARREGRSLSQQIGRLIDAGLEHEEGSAIVTREAAGSLAGLLARGPVPEYREFRAVRTLLSASLSRAGKGHGATGR